MSLLVRAAVLGGLAYVVSRAVRRADASTFLNRSNAARLNRADARAGAVSRDSDDGLDLGWPNADRPSTTSA